MSNKLKMNLNKGIGILILTLLLLSIVCNSNVYATYYKNGTVTEMGVRLRSTPQTTDKSNVIAYMHTGNKVTIYDQIYSDNRMWYQVAFNNIKGYAAAEFIKTSDNTVTDNNYPNEDLNNYSDYEKNESTIWNYFKNKGLNDYATAGLMGNLKCESGLIPINMENRGENNISLTGGKAYNDVTYTRDVDNQVYLNFVFDGIGYGLAQWTYYTRKANLLDFSRLRNTSVGNLNTQLDFLWDELNSYYSGVLSDLRNAASVKSASDSVLLNFERPADMSDRVKRYRESVGIGIFNKYSNRINTDEGIYPRWDNDKYLKSKDVYACNEWVFYNSSWYYIKSDNYYQKDSWLEYNNEWYYLKSDGKMAKNEWKGDYYLKDDGACARNQWIYDSNIDNWFYIDSNWKYKSKEWFLYKGDWYYLKENGEMAKNEMIDDYFVNDDGIWVK